MHVLKQLVGASSAGGGGSSGRGGGADSESLVRLSAASAKATLSSCVAPAELVRRCIAAGDVAAALFESTFVPPERVGIHINVMRGTQASCRRGGC